MNRKEFFVWQKIEVFVFLIVLEYVLRGGNRMKAIKSITVNSNTYTLGQAYKPPGFTDGATVTDIRMKRNIFSSQRDRFEVLFDTGELLCIHSTDVIVHWSPSNDEN